MPVFAAINPDVEVNGETVISVIDGIALKSMAIDILSKNGIKDPKAGLWYSQQNWLNAFKEISQRLSPLALFSIGSKIPENAKFPPQINSIEKALGAINVAYHMNHRLNGKILFDPQSGKLHEGIGHYIFAMQGDGKEAKMTCPNPYPCDFDRGIISGMAKKFKPSGSSVQVIHNDSAPCRKKGSESCEYFIKW